MTERTEKTDSEQFSLAEAAVLPLREAIDGLRDLNGRNYYAANMIADDRLCFAAHQAMVQKLRKKREEGRGGWWNPDECSVEFLRECLHAHLLKGDMVDVMNFAAMIYAREMLDPDGE